ncbi:C39 family peptidase [Lactobacillus sp. ESL0703]|uniref:C39 family peptidase n=1 Tax=Lactobacillus sp. ESL0703 TaxID=2983218 RepID=UPI0023F9A3E3|nr:C39 family peptidase [Lactobacillus sp. ESL0703]MDF7668702.1 C39 family peptidase [Lactobacillus sp. ESL0703]
MEIIYHFHNVQTIIVSRQAAVLTNDDLQISATCEIGQKLSANNLVKDNQQNIYFNTAQGLLSFNDAYFEKLNYFSELDLFTQLKWGKIKNPRGTNTYSSQHQLLAHQPLASSLQLVGQGEDIFHQTWLMTSNGTWLKRSDVWLDGEPLITRSHDLSQTETIIINPHGSIARDHLGQSLDLIKPDKQLSVLAVKEDEFGNEYLQIGPDTFIPTTDCLLHDYPKQLKSQSSQLLITENINQMFWGIQNGCEAAALLMGLHYQGKLKTTDYQTFINEMPLSPDYNPYHGFGGSPYENVTGRFEAIFPPALLTWGKKFTTLRDLNGANEPELIAAIKRGNPVLTYVTTNFTPPDPDTYPWGKTYKNNHAVLLDGFSEDLFHVSDPIDGHYWLTKSAFMQAYNVRQWAIEIM